MTTEGRVELIAEISSNHGGSIPLAKEFIWRFTEAGADWIKFQTTRVKHLRPDDPQYEWFQRAELSDESHHELKAECARAGVKFLTTVYHVAEVPFLASVGLEAIKIGSGEAGERSLAEAVMRHIPSVLVALGLCNNNPYESVFVQDEWAGRVTFLGAVTRYPAPHGIATQVLRGHSMTWATTGPWCGVTGWSDHACGIDECRAAIIDGARIIEKHVCLPEQARPVRPWEATVDEFKALRAFADEDPQRFIGRWQAA